MNRLLRKVVDVRRNELGTALLMFAYSFFAMTAYNILKPLTRSKFIQQLGADNIPYVQLAAGLLIGVLMHGYSHAIRQLPRRLVIPVTQAGLVVLLLVTWALFRTGAAWVPVAFYVLGLVLGILLISQFWTLANDLYDARQAKRLFGFIGGGASLGGAMGAGITALVVEEVGADNLLLVSAAILAVCVGLVLAIAYRQNDDSPMSLEDQQGVGGREALRLLSESRHLQVVALVIGFAAIGAAIIEQQLNMATEAMKSPGAADSMAAFFATVTFYLSVIGFGVQVLLTSRIHRSFGLAVALLLLPVTLGGTGIVILFSGALWATAVARILDSTLRYTVDKTTREILFLPLPAELKYRAKPFLDVTVDRLGKALAAILLLVLIKPWGFGLDWRRLSYASVTVTALWIAVALVARRQYLRSFRASIGMQAIAPDAVRADTTDAATIETLIEELSNPDEGAVLYAIDMLEALDKRNLVSPLLLHHDSPRVRARALVALQATKIGTADRWIRLVTRMLGDEDADVRAGAIRALSVLRHEEAAAVMRRCLDDVEPRIAVTAAVGLADSGAPEDIAAATATLRAFIDDPREVAVPARREVAAGLARVRNPDFRHLLVPLLYDRSSAVAAAAIASAGALGAADGLFIPALVSHLGDRTLKAAARKALIGYGETVLDALGMMLADPREHVWIRRHLPATIAATATPRARDILVKSLNDPDGFLRYKVLQALEDMTRSRPDLTLPHAALEAQVFKESARYFSYLTFRSSLTRYVTGPRPLVLRALDDKLSRTLGRLYRLLGLMYSPDDVRAARHAIEHGESRRQAAAVEYLDNLFGGAVRKRMMPILEQMSPEERVQRANAILKTRPRDLEDTIAQLVHEDDPVLASTAIHFIADHRLSAFAADLEFVATHRPDQPYVADAAAWAIAARPGPATSPDAERLLPVVEIAHRLSTIALFESVPVDELFRIAEAGQQVGYPAGRELCAAGRVPDALHILLDGQLSVSTDGEVRCVSAPSALVFDYAIRRTPMTSSIRCDDRAALLRLERDQFLTMLADDPTLAQGVFRMLLCGEHGVPSANACVLPTGYAATGPVQAVDKVFFLRQHSWLEGASFRHLHALASVTHEVSLEMGRTLVGRGDAPAIYQVLEGDVLLQSETGAPVRVRPGGTFGLVETLTDTPWALDATAASDGRALRIDREDVWIALSDVGFLESLLCGALSMRTETAAAPA